MYKAAAVDCCYPLIRFTVAFTLHSPSSLLKFLRMVGPTLVSNKIKIYFSDRFIIF